MADAEMTQRLEKLERDNRRLKGFAIAALVLAATFGAIYATQPVPQKIAAREFDVVDSSGRARIRMAMGALHQPDIALMDAKGFYHVELYLVADESGGNIALTGTPSGPSEVPSTTFLSDDGLTLFGSGGDELDLGAGTTTRRTKPTGVASIVMFGNDKDDHVIWRAP
jgi:hypothetical protein